MMTCMRFGDMTFEEIAEAAAAGAIAVVPTGCTEQQGPHLPVDNDTWFAESLAVAAAEQVAPDVTAVVLPALPFGPTPEHRGFGAGFVDIPIPVYDRFVRSILDSLADQGFARIVVWRGCGGHDLVATICDFNHDRDGASRAFLPAHPFHLIWCSIADPAIPGGHADSFTTSILQHRRPESVRRDRIPDDSSDEPDWSDADLDFSAVSSTGVIGSAAHASPELGAVLWHASVDAVADVLRQIDADPDSVRMLPTMPLEP
jgi:creatinine amidohydrolase